MTLHRAVRVAAYVAGVAAIVVAGLLFESSAAKLRRSQAATVVGCEHTAVLIAQQNRQGLVLYKLARLIGESPAVPPQFVPDLRSLARTAAWIPITDCRSAVDSHGAYYKLPAAVLFSKRLPSRAQLNPPKAGIAR